MDEIPEELKREIESKGYTLNEVVIFESGLWMSKKDYDYALEGNKEICKTCRYWRFTHNENILEDLGKCIGLGTCHRYPPNRGELSENIPSNHWCGEFKEKATGDSDGQGWKSL